MKGVYFVFIILILILSNSCSEKWIMDVDPRDYEFENDYIQTKWEYYLDLEDCKKVEYLDSIYRPILEERIFKLSDSTKSINTKIDSSLISITPKKENFYYWVFREVHRLTNLYPSVYITHWGYGGVTNRQSVPFYIPEDSLKFYYKDISDWKNKLGCD